ncbi:unnamed protein product [Ilex paraguariensis]|uniref:Uncharacterized protein n=1 Tax=Ilex paraguariensis TaxID=185542 RepID=A0ABC8V5I1_9AQUA
MFIPEDEFKANVSNGLSSISTPTSHSGIFGSAHLVPRHRLQGLEVAVSGYALQCKPRGLMFFMYLTRSQCAAIRNWCQKLEDGCSFIHEDHGFSPHKLLQ